MTDPAEVARRSAEAMWADDQASQALGMRVVDIGPGTATLEMTVRADMVNGHGIGHGGFTFSLADSAFAFACNSHNRRTVGHRCEITYLAPVHLDDVLVATATERSREGRDGTYDVVVSTGTRVVAEMVGHSREVRGTLYDEEP
jgi:acyl-CoA thioesterase